jgi:WXG100 family type VII secretion target
MPQAIIDPGELRRFAHNLKQFNDELQTQLAALHGQLLHLGNTWRDQEHQKFAEEFEHTMQVVARFVTAADEHIPFLLRKAQRAEEYLQQR